MNFIVKNYLRTLLVATMFSSRQQGKSQNRVKPDHSWTDTCDEGPTYCQGFAWTLSTLEMDLTQDRTSASPGPTPSCCA